MIDVFQKSGLGRNHDLHVALPAWLFRALLPAAFRAGIDSDGDGWYENPAAALQ